MINNQEGAAMDTQAFTEINKKDKENSKTLDPKINQNLPHFGSDTNWRGTLWHKPQTHTHK